MSVVEKIRKLMNLAADGSATEGEVENALRFARRLMDEYGITEDQVTVVAPDRVQVTETQARTAGVITPWQRSLAWVPCYVCDVRCFTRRESSRTQLVFVGLPRDTAVAAALYADLLVMIRAMARYRFGTGFGTQHRSYARGFTDALISKARGMQEQSRVAPSAGAIVLAKDAIIRRYMQERLNLRTAVTREQSVSLNAYHRGKEDGSRADIGVVNRLK